MTDFSLPDVLAPAWTSGCPTIAPSGGTFVTHDDWGFYDNFLAVAVLKDQHLRLIDMKDGSTDRGGVIIAGQGRLRVAVEGPDGLLYILTDEANGRIFTVDPVQ
jgi:glucose/arabinose dehydrogenase